MFYYANKNQWYNGRIIPSHDTNSSSTLSMNNTSQLSPFFIYKNYYRRVVIIQWLMAIPPLWIVFSKASYSHVFLWYQSFGSCYRFYPNPIFFLFVICLKFVFCSVICVLVCILFCHLFGSCWVLVFILVLAMFLFLFLLDFVKNSIWILFKFYYKIYLVTIWLIGMNCCLLNLDQW